MRSSHTVLIRALLLLLLLLLTLIIATSRTGTGHGKRIGRIGSVRRLGASTATGR